VSKMIKSDSSLLDDMIGYENNGEVQWVLLIGFERFSMVKTIVNGKVKWRVGNKLA